jgi:hypothetical protein
MIRQRSFWFSAPTADAIESVMDAFADWAESHGAIVARGNWWPGHKKPFTGFVALEYEGTGMPYVQRWERLERENGVRK